MEESSKWYVQIWIYKVSSASERIKHIRVRVRGIIEVDAKGILDERSVEILFEVRGRGGVIIWMSDIIGPTATEFVIRLFDVRSALVSCLHADDLADISRTVDLVALANLVLTATGHLIGEFHIVVDGVVHSFDAIGIVDGELGIL